MICSKENVLAFWEFKMFIVISRTIHDAWVLFLEPFDNGKILGKHSLTLQESVSVNERLYWKKQTKSVVLIEWENKKCKVSSVLHQFY